MSYRHKVNKHRGASSFRRQTQHTKAINLAPPPMRGGIRL